MNALDVVVTGVAAVARDVLALTLRARGGQSLPGAGPGAHVDLHLPNGLVRSYSLVNALGAAQMDEYVVAVGRDVRSRGGSQWVHEMLRVGQPLRLGGPRNHFDMDPAHRRVLLLAGGIGITPLYAMARHCAAQGLDWTLWACARSASRLAFAEELKALAGDRLRLHADDADGGPMDLAQDLRERRWDGLYACGPAPMLDAVTSATAHWPARSVRMERFKAEAACDAPGRSFELELVRSGLHTTVAPDETVLSAIERLGVDHPTACREGLCGTCEAAVHEGEVLHRDTVLDAQERAQHRRMMVCVSRCAGERLVLDL